MILPVQTNRNQRRGAFLLGIGIVVAIVILILTPWNVYNLTSQPHPVQSYAEAVQRVESLQQREPAGMNPVCRLQFMSHGKKVERAIILVHGYSNCPQQFEALGQRFYGLGYNVLVAPLPHHGLAEAMTEEQARLSAEELVQFTDEVVDIAQDLRRQGEIVGISGGGIITAYAAQGLNLAVQAEARRQVPTARVLVIASAGDSAIKNKLIRALVTDWRQHCANLTTLEFPAELKPGHDFIDPENPDMPIGVIYPKLIDAMTQEPPSSRIAPCFIFRGSGMAVFGVINLLA